MCNDANTDIPADFLMPATAPNPMDAPAYRWGILGAGGIARKLTDAVQNYTTSQVLAVASASSLANAQAFAEEQNIERSYGSYAELVGDPDIDIVYVATPHSNHLDPALLAINAGKHVLVEKPFMQNAAQAQQVVDAARARGVFVMEAMWAPHLPHMYAVRDLIARGEIGDVVSVQADHGQSLGHVERLVRPELAGGALLDLGVYPVTLVHNVLGVPDKVTAAGRLGETGVDAQVAVVMDYAKAQGVATTTMESRSANTAQIAGTQGCITLDDMFYSPTTFALHREDGTVINFDGTVANGFQFEVAEVARCVAAGLTESPLHSLDHTLEIMRTLDEVRDQIGLVYPNER
ncbi:Gfo/Idh/MocA family protein [Demequina sediminicola]|uniref:Gfo/Idh/MocA family protein n=1 Tax=Demequina sediminicola TaxID=1095026 RepID=UPI0009E37697|nr:Gfo/Idh/MocA family oxidoreductase [Demequina sediminicola]